MQHTLDELERTPDSLPASSQHTITGKKAPPRPRRLRLYLYILKGVLLLTLTLTTFSDGVHIISQNAKALGFFVLNFDVPLPFLLIGLWGIVVLVLAILSLTTIVKICVMLSPLVRRFELVRRRAA